MGGRAAEKVIFNKISTGALSDLEKVTKQAKAMVTVYGLSEKIGNLTYYDSSGQSDYNFTKPYSDKTSELIDEEISKIIEEQYKRAIGILENHKGQLNELADLLLEKEVIFKDDLVKIFGERPFIKPEMIDNTERQKKKSDEREANQRASEERNKQQKESEDKTDGDNNDDPKKDDKVESN
jgi:cell division protease FtsH